jgi:hypothetical protein
MKNHFQIPILFASIGTLSISIFSFAPAADARCYNSYGTTVDCDLQRQSEIRNGQREQMRKLDSIIQDTRPKFGTGSTYQSTPNYQSTPSKPTYTAEEEASWQRDIDRAERCEKAGGSLQQCYGDRVLR